MILLKIISDYPPVDLTFLDAKDVPVILLIVVLLFFAYYKVKRNKKFVASEEVVKKNDAVWNFLNYDILMQPKKNIEYETPLVNFSITKFSFKEFILWIALIIFYYLIFTERI